MDIVIDKADKSPAYKQLARQLEAQILSGTFRPGGKLPTERDLEKATGLSRGTIKAAYHELQKAKKIVTIQGSGTFVTQHDHVESRRMAREALQDLLERLYAIGVTPLEVSSIFSQVLEQYLQKGEKVRIIWIDCCEEVLSAIRYQLRNSKEISLATVLMPEFHKNYDELVKDCDLIVTTPWHFNEVSFSIPSYLDIIERVMMDLDINSVIEIAQIPPGSKMVLWSGSQAFMEIMVTALDDFDNLNPTYTFVGLENIDEIYRCLQDSDVLLTAPLCTDTNCTKINELISEFQARGKKAITFDYHVNKGSMLHFQDRVLEIYQQKNKK